MDIFDVLQGNGGGLDIEVEKIKPCDLVKDGEFFVSKSLWVAMRDGLEQDVIIELFHRAVVENKISFPYTIPSEGVAMADYEALLQVDSYDQFYYGSWFSKKLLTDKWYDLTYNGQKVILGRNYKGLKASDRFQNKARMNCGHIRQLSPMNKWTKENSRRSLWRGLWSLEIESEINAKTILKLIRARGYVASQFRTANAKAVCDVFKAKKVLDFCSGWGDRLCGFYASNAEEYLGIDPNTALHSGYQAQVEFYGGHKKTTFICSPAEEADLSEYEEYFDLIMTSPPYFIQELYCDEETQSWKRYKKDPQRWLNNFLFKAIENAWSALREGGRLVINIADVLYNTNDYINICHQMNNFIETLPNAHYEGVIGYELAQRMGKGQRGNTKGTLNLLNGDGQEGDKPAEPMWIWSKGKQEPISFVKQEVWE